MQVPDDMTGENGVLAKWIDQLVCLINAALGGMHVDSTQRTRLDEGN